MLAFVAELAAADVCRYVDGEGLIHYSNIRPENGWTLLTCGEGSDDAPQKTGKFLEIDNRWHAALRKIRIGMTREQLTAIDPPLLRQPDERRAIESALGVTEWLYFSHFSVIMRDGRVAKIIY